MQEAYERLREIRQARFASAAEAARALGIPPSTYTLHENGKRGFALRAERYADFFRVSVDWLLTGQGGRRGQSRTIPIVGKVGAGAVVHPIRDDTAATALDEIDLPDVEHLGAYEVEGDSQYPRYLNREIVMFDSRAVAAGQLLNQYAVVDLADGRRLLKMLRKMPQPGRYRLESHNAAPEDDAEIVAAYRVKGTLTR